MIGIRSTQPACDCMYRLYDCGIYRRTSISVFMNPPHDLSVVTPSTYVADFEFDDTP
jgi:hypothetical protein